MMAAGIAMANPEMSLRAIGAQLEAMRERTPRGGRQWAASSVKNLLDKAEKLGLAPSINNPLFRFTGSRRRHRLMAGVDVERTVSKGKASGREQKGRIG